MGRSLQNLKTVLIVFLLCAKQEARYIPDKSWLSNFNIFVYGLPSIEYLEAISGTAIAWSVYHGGLNQKELAYVRRLHKAGVKVISNFPTMQASESVVGKDEEFLMGYACKGPDGEPAKALWIQPEPPYLPCHNNKDWQKFLEDRLKEHIKGEVDAVHIDEIEGIGGHIFYIKPNAGFCNWCMEGFKEYLEGKYSKQELEELGVDIDNFASRATNLAKDPLRKDFVMFQLESRFNQLETIYGHIAFAGNTFFMSPNKQLFLKLIDAAIFENSLSWMGVYAGVHMLCRAIFKVLGKPPVCVMFPNIINIRDLGKSGKDWKLIPHWLAEGVASGGNFLVPYRAYPFGGGIETVKGPDVTTCPEEVIAPFSRFFIANSEVFWGAEPEAEVGVVYDYRKALEQYLDYGFLTPYAAIEEVHQRFLEITEKLVRMHVPFDVVYRGDGKFIEGETRKEFKVIIEDEIPPLEAFVLDTTASGNLGIFPWRKGDTRIIHFVNYNYREHNFVPEEFSLKVDYSDCKVLVPDESEVECLAGEVRGKIYIYAMVVLR